MAEQELEEQIRAPLAPWVTVGMIAALVALFGFLVALGRATTDLLTSALGPPKAPPSSLALIKGDLGWAIPAAAALIAGAWTAWHRGKAGWWRAGPPLSVTGVAGVSTAAFLAVNGVMMLSTARTIGGGSSLSMTLWGIALVLVSVLSCAGLLILARETAKHEDVQGSPEGLGRRS